MARSNPLWHFLILFVVGFGAAAEGADVNIGLPRYRLEVGQELNYKGESDFKYKNGSARGYRGSGSQGFRDEWKVWIVRKNDDGNRRVVIRLSRVLFEDGKDIGSPRSNLAYCDVFDDGRIVWNQSLSDPVDPMWLFPRLPADRRQVAGGWQDIREHGENSDGRASFRVDSEPGSPAGVWSIREVHKSPTDEIYLNTDAWTVTFDPRRGLVTRAQSEHAEGYNFRGKGTGSLELVSVERRDAQWTKQLCEEADRYFQAGRAYEEKTEQAVNDDKRSKQLMEEADALLEAARSAVSLPIIKEQLDQQLTSHKWRATNIVAEAARRAKVVGHPAAAWELPDLKGKSHSLKEYRGKVVILDFWYRGCHPCMRALPQVKQLAAEFQGQPVVVLGMSVDESEADARFVVDKMRVDYTTLKTDWELPQKYAAHACPLLVIIDQKGTVRDLHVGYSQSLQREVGEIVRQLLAKK
jgi:peroxiredoxin